MEKGFLIKHENVQEYYGKTMQSSADLQTNACCEPAEMPSCLKKFWGSCMMRF